MGRIFMCVLSLSLSGALTVLLILLLRPFTGRLFSKRWNYYIWLLVVARLLLPVYIDMDFRQPVMGKFHRGELAGKCFIGKLPMEMAAAGEGYLLAVAGSPKESWEQHKDRGQGGAAPLPALGTEPGQPGIGGNAQGASFPDWGLVCGGCWLLGAALCLGVKIKRYLDFAGCVKKEYTLAKGQEVLQAVGRISRRLSIKRPPLVYECGKVSAPLVVGLLKPVIVLPEKGRDDPGLCLAIHHELVHIKRKDLWYKWLYQILLCAHWFNPVIYLGGRKLNADCELSCDEAVVGTLTPEGKRAYGNTLLDAAEQSVVFMGSVPSVTLLERKEDLKMRLKGILHYKKQSHSKAAVSLGAAAAMVFLSACGSVQVAPDAMPVEVSGDAYTQGDSFWDWAAMKVKSWAGSGLDGFLSKPVLVNKAGKAWQSYEDDGLLAGEDISGQWHMYSYYGGDRVRCDGMYLNGSATVLIANAKKEVDIQVHSSFRILSGRFKIIHVAPDGKVTALNETGEKGYVDVTCQEGRNVIKFVGQGAKISGLKVDYQDLHDWDFESIFYSQEEEKTQIVAENIKNGTAEKEEIMKLLPYLGEETVSQAAALLFKQQAVLGQEELYQLLIYSDSSLTTDYLVEAVRQGEMPPLSGDTIAEIAPFLEKGGVTKLLLCMEEGLTPGLVNRCVPYMEDWEITDFLVAMEGSLTADIVCQNAPLLGDEGLKEVMLAMGGELTGELAYQCAPYLREEGLREVLLILGERGRLTGETIYQCAPHLGEEGLREVLLSMGDGLEFDLLYQCAPYLGEDGMARCLRGYMELGNGVNYTQLEKISPYLSKKEKERLAGLMLIKPSED